jgi:hypothetical protein
MGLYDQYQEQEQKAAAAMQVINECYAKMQTIAAKMKAEGMAGPASIKTMYGPTAAERARENVSISQQLSAVARERYAKVPKH